MKKPMTIFEILGATHLEDCYSWLLHHAFNASAEFQERLIRALDEYPGVPVVGWDCHAQFRVRFEGRMQIPDLVFCHQATRRLIVLEVKTHAGERPGQSRSYAGPCFLGACCAALKTSELAPTYRWLTPDGWRPEDKNFQPITFGRVAAALRPCTFTEPRLSLLAQDFIALVDELESCEPEPDVSVREFLKGRRLLTYNHNLACFGRTLQVAPAPVRQRLIEYDETGGLLNLPYYQWILRDSDAALELALQGEQKGDATALTLMFLYHCWDKEQQREKADPGWTRRYNAGREAYKNGLYRRMDQLRHSGWHPTRRGAKMMLKKPLAATEPCSKAIGDANRAIAELLRVLGDLGGPSI